jgi:hypothetical protein
VSFNIVDEFGFSLSKAEITRKFKGPDLKIRIGIGFTFKKKARVIILADGPVPRVNLIKLVCQGLSPGTKWHKINKNNKPLVQTPVKIALREPIVIMASAA